MIYDSKNGKNQIYLEEGEKLFVTTVGNEEYKSVELKNVDGKVVIKGLNDVVSKEENTNVSEKYDESDFFRACATWLEYFVAIHDKLRAKAFSSVYSSTPVTMKLYAGGFSVASDKEESKVGKEIELKLQSTLDSNLFNGVNIEIYDENESLYRFLLASVLNHYIKANYGEHQIEDKYDRVMNANLFSCMKPEGRVQPVFASLASLTNASVEYYVILDKLITNHNIGISSDSFILDLKNNITEEVKKNTISTLVESINHSKEQLEKIEKYFGSEEKGPNKR